MRFKERIAWGEMKRAAIVITGASSGIGEAFARHYARVGYSVVLVARRKERLEALAVTLRGHGVEAAVLAEDLREPAAPERIAAAIERLGWEVEGLVNNAGLGFQASFASMSREQLESMMAVNIAALVRMARVVLPSMLERRRGFILNIASTAGFQPVPYFAVYAASKAFVVSFSEALHEEVRGQGVQVAALCPGPVDTEFQQVAGMNPRFFARSQHVDEVVAAGMALLRRRGALGWTSWSQWWVSFSVRWLPRVWVRKLAAALLRASGAR